MGGPYNIVQGQTVTSCYMKKKLQHIPRFDISPHTKAGIFIEAMENHHLMEANHDIHQPHRDNHHLLLLLKEGWAEATVDLKTVRVQAPAIGMIYQDQVHHVKEYAPMKGYTLTFEPAIMPAALQHALEEPRAHGMLWTGDAVLIQELFTLADTLYALKQKPAQALVNQAMQSLLHAMLYLLAGASPITASVKNSDKRGEKITRDFLQLLQQHYRQWTRPAVYATALSITTSHLNDSVRTATGFSVSHHIQEAMMLEAKRLLSHTGMSVKEITYAVGLEDHGYFSRLFKKVVGQTPLQFRQQFRE